MDVHVKLQQKDARELADELRRVADTARAKLRKHRAPVWIDDENEPDWIEGSYDALFGSGSE